MVIPCQTFIVQHVTVHLFVSWLFYPLTEDLRPVPDNYILFFFFPWKLFYFFGLLVLPYQFLGKH